MCSAIYVGQSIDQSKIRKKPGRKPNPASPVLRKAQNRAAQRAFRERKERHLKDLESTIHQLKHQKNSAVKELESLKRQMDSFRAENWYLKGVVLTLQFVCLHHNIHIPTHSPYLTEDDLSEMAKTTPHAIESYVNAYTKNNIDLKPTMASHFANQSASVASDTTDDGEKEEDDDDEEDEDEDEDSVMKDEDIDVVKVEEQVEDIKLSNTSAIQHLRLQLRVQSALSSFNKKSTVRLQPTILQLAIPHDPRIDLIPTPHMRDRMIIFRDQMDYDRCFSILLNGAVYHGGDPTMSASWELPPEFFAEFWYLAINYEANKTNTWRKLQCQDESNYSDIFNHLTQDMPTLQPLDSSHLSSGFDFGTPSPTLFDGYLLHRPAFEYQEPPNLDTMLDFMNSFTTDK